MQEGFNQLRIKVDPMKLDGREYKVYFPKGSRYEGYYVILNLSKAKVDKAELNSLIIEDKKYSKYTIHNGVEQQIISFDELIYVMCLEILSD